ncbi:hypothetical protein L211DRAFT_841656 [Terfezia boudieri ATCC MYA-4762]|uniref:Uncharacterized protein n=1 Tax=Terfezia boudieri ATCC MYA-4762 TaxID=1051890 RepID=A0A3N4LC03_9PEZI|nr:hypothetical protein L211DRAFT_841656 [Terfezia boudieri ATCC MYA-4762]
MSVIWSVSLGYATPKLTFAEQHGICNSQPQAGHATPYLLLTVNLPAVSARTSHIALCVHDCQPYPCRSSHWEELVKPYTFS